jgi:hypothetical protein
MILMQGTWCVSTDSEQLTCATQIVSDMRVKMRKPACLLVLAQLFANAAGAHSWYPKECCSDNDCRPVPCAELVRGKQGLGWLDRVIFNTIRRTIYATSASCHMSGTSLMSRSAPLFLELRARSVRASAAQTASIGVSSTRRRWELPPACH